MQHLYQESNSSGGRRSGLDRRVFADPDYPGKERRAGGDRRKGTRERSHPRFRAKEGTYAAIKADYHLIGLIKDISKGGISFRYTFNGKQVKGALKIDIFSKGREFFIKNVPFKIVADSRVDNKVPFSTITLRQCGGQFGAMTDEQMFQLEQFIQKYTSMVKRSSKDRRKGQDPNYDGPERRSGVDRRSATH